MVLLRDNELKFQRMQITNSVIQLAKERAQFGFGVLTQRMLQDVDERIMELQSDVRYGSDRTALLSARQFIQASGKAFAKRVDLQYRELLDRAMQTMYTDLRVSVRELSADNLTLIDDETVNHRIEVDRLVLRLRDADDEHLRQLNLIIGQLHGDRDARERENPFRPYLMARTLHQVLHDMVRDEDTRTRLFALMSESLAARLADFYASIREVFESNGLHAELMAQKSRQSNRQRDFDNNTVASAGLDVNARVLPGLQRMLAAMSQAPVPAGAEAPANAGTPDNSAFPTLHATSATPIGEEAARAFHNFVNGIFKLSEALPANDSGLNLVPQTSGQHEGVLQAGSDSLVARLKQYQKQAALGNSLDERIAPEQNQLFALGEQLGPDQITKLERIAIDVVAMLFELILSDEQIPETLRKQIGRLQIPFLKAAMLMPDMLRQTQHPARQLVNRMGTVAVGLDLSSPLGRAVEQEIARIVNRILTEFDDDISIFADSLFELERFLTDNLRHANSGTELGVEALEDVEQRAAQEATGKEKSQTGGMNAPAWLAEFDIDQSVAGFIVDVWMHVVEQESVIAAGSGGARVYRDLLPDLIWSVQNKATNEERAVLVNMLPSLANRLKEGLSLVQMTPKESSAALDLLMAAHTRVLRAGADGGPSQWSLEGIRAHFSRLSLGTDQPAMPEVESREIESELAKRGVAVDLDLEREATPSFESDADWLTHIQVGACVERWSDSGYQMARLAWISKRQTLYMFLAEGEVAPVVYSAIALIKSLREGSVRLVERAPVFERAVESLLMGARAVENNRED